MSNERLVQHLELWLAVDGQVSVDSQKEFFEEIMFRLLAMNYEKESMENGS